MVTRVDQRTLGSFTQSVLKTPKPIPQNLSELLGGQEHSWNTPVPNTSGQHLKLNHVHYRIRELCSSSDPDTVAPLHDAST